MLRRTLSALLLVLPAALSAQEGTIAYSHSIKIDFELPPEMRARIEARGGNRAGGAGGMLPTERVSEVILLFKGSESLMKPVPPAPRVGGPPGAGDRRPGMAARMRMASASRRDRETVVEAYVQHDEGTIVEAREFLGRTFLIEDEVPALQWRLTGEQAEFLDYVVQKAVAQQDSSTVEAWFTPQIPISGGPAMYGGLPGMILVVSVDDGEIQYNATAVSLTAVDEGVIVRPTEGEAVTRDEYEEIVAEKLEELRVIRGRNRS
jgi:hypothetical protein